MKKFAGILTALVACSALFLGCNKDKAALIEGEWTMNLDKSYYAYIVDHNNKAVDAVTGATYEDENGNTVEKRYMNERCDGATFTFDAENATMEFITNGVNQKTVQKYSIADDILTIGREEWEILQLEDNSLVIERTNDAAPEGKTNRECRHYIFSKK